MLAAPPRPRYRLYVDPSDFLAIARETACGSSLEGGDCTQLENAIRSRFKTPHAQCMPQARMGIYMAIKALVKPGKKVILSPYTIADVINIVICAGAVPVFADIERSTCNIDPEEIERLVDADTGAVMITHLHGLACDVERIAEFCRAKGLPLIEDAAQAFGTEVGGRKLGTFGDAGIYSFGMYKNVTGFFGGMLVTPHADIHHKVAEEMASWKPFSTARYLDKVKSGLMAQIATSWPLFQLLTFWIFRYGRLNDIRAINRFVETELDLSLKSVLPESYLRTMRPMQARMVLRHLDDMEAHNSLRIRSAAFYANGLEGVGGLILPPTRSDGSHIYTYYPVQYRDRMALVKAMTADCRDIGVQHLKNCAGLPSFAHWARDCPRARETADQTVLLPTWPGYTERDIQANVKSIRSFLATGAKC